MTINWTTEQIFAQVEGLVKKWGNIVVPIFAGSPKSELALNGIGSAFIVQAHKRLFLVTALHVLNDANSHKQQIANINGTAVSLRGLAFQISPEHDLALTELTLDWLGEKGVQSVKSISLTRPGNEWNSIGGYILLGYPSTRNELDLRYDKTARFCLSLSVGLAQDKKVKTPIKDPVLFSYEPKSVVDSTGEKISPPNLSGMSGGPSLEIFLKRTGSNASTFTCSVAGVICEWKRGEKRIVATPVEAVAGLIKCA